MKHDDISRTGAAAMPDGVIDGLEPHPLSGRRWLPWRKLLDCMTEVSALLGSDGTILFANRSWKRSNDFKALYPGSNLVEWLQCREREGNKDAGACVAGLMRIIAGTRESFRHRYRDRRLGHEVSGEVRFDAFVANRERFIVAAANDLTELVNLRRTRHRLGSALLHAQGRERRRIARELHDSTSQLLVALQLDLAKLRKGADGAGGWSSVVDDCTTTLSLAQRELRTLSFIYHPPSLEDGGFVAAMRQLAEGFAARTGLSIRVRSNSPVECSGLVEEPLYRVVQEALANIHRHARATDVDLLLEMRRRFIHLVIKDNGIGLYAAHEAPWAAGVGMAAMRERMIEIGGRLTIRSGSNGTILIASIERQAVDDLSAGLKPNPLDVH
jgi:two-component system NarL family sensor kinase